MEKEEEEDAVGVSATVARRVKAEESERSDVGW